jgi:hypothetical protein
MMTSDFGPLFDKKVAPYLGFRRSSKHSPLWKKSATIDYMFINADLELRIDNHILTYKHRTISTFGTTGLPWSPLRYEEHFGRKVFLSLKILRPVPFRLELSAAILKETSEYAIMMALKFILTTEQKHKLSQFIEKHGKPSTTQLRKYPRIPAMDYLQTFPFIALVDPLVLNEHASEDYSLLNSDDDAPIYSVYNLSPNGILIASDHSRAAPLEPGDLVQLTLAPRGSNQVPIQMEGLVCRSFEELVSSGGPVINKQFGVRFTRITPANKEAFNRVLKDILIQIKSTFTQT